MKLVVSPISMVSVYLQKATRVIISSRTRNVSTVIKSNHIEENVWQILRNQAFEMIRQEPLLTEFVNDCLLKHSTFQDALIHRLATKLNGELVDTKKWIDILQTAFTITNRSVAKKDDLKRLAFEDLIAVEQRDPACHSIAQAFLFFKGFKALQAHRIAHVFWNYKKRHLAYLIQTRSSELFGVDIHPAAHIGGGLMIDHATGVVIGETAVIGENCSMLHGVTLGGTGKHSGDRHPKIGNNVSIGCNASILGNIDIGNDCKIGSGTMVLKSLSSGATAIGNPAKVISRIESLTTTNEAYVGKDAGKVADKKEGSIEIEIWEGKWYPKNVVSYSCS